MLGSLSINMKNTKENEHELENSFVLMFLSTFEVKKPYMYTVADMQYFAPENLIL